MPAFAHALRRPTRFAVVPSSSVLPSIHTVVNDDTTQTTTIVRRQSYPPSITPTSDGTGLPSPAIGGAIIASLVGFILIVVICCFCCRRGGKWPSTPSTPARSSPPRSPRPLRFATPPQPVPPIAPPNQGNNQSAPPPPGAPPAPPDPPGPPQDSSSQPQRPITRMRDRTNDHSSPQRPGNSIQQPLAPQPPLNDNDAVSQPPAPPSPPSSGNPSNISGHTFEAPVVLSGSRADNRGSSDNNGQRPEDIQQPLEDNHIPPPPPVMRFAPQVMRNPPPRQQQHPLQPVRSPPQAVQPPYLHDDYFRAFPPEYRGNGSPSLGAAPLPVPVHPLNEPQGPPPQTAYVEVATLQPQMIQEVEHRPDAERRSRAKQQGGFAIRDDGKRVQVKRKPKKAKEPASPTNTHIPLSDETSSSGGGDRVEEVIMDRDDLRPKGSRFRYVPGSQPLSTLMR